MSVCPQDLLGSLLLSSSGCESCSVLPADSLSSSVHLPSRERVPPTGWCVRRQGHHLYLQSAALALAPPPAERTCALGEVHRPLKALLLLSAEQGWWFEASLLFCCDIWTKPSANEASYYKCSPPFSASQSTRSPPQLYRFLVRTRSFDFTPIIVVSP